MPAMQTLYAAANPLEAEILRCYLAEHGIGAQIFGAGLWSGLGELPADSWPRLVLEDEQQAPRAQELLRRYEHHRHTAALWACRCGESSPIHFELCWHCGQERPR